MLLPNLTAIRLIEYLSKQIAEGEIKPNEQLLATIWTMTEL